MFSSLLLYFRNGDKSNLIDSFLEMFFNLFKIHRYDQQLSRLRCSRVNPALELPIPIIDVPLNRFSEPNLRYEKTVFRAR